MIIKGYFTGLTPAEKVYLISHPQYISIIRENTNKSFNISRKKFPNLRRHNDRGDAFRHCYWAALLARDIGYHNAKKFTTAHENYSLNPSKERAMDLYNNNIGLEVGRKKKDISDVILIQKCLNSLNLGELKFKLPSKGEGYKMFSN